MGVANKAGRMGAAVGISRILGLVREQVFAHLFGAGFYSDAFLIAFRIPNLFRDFFAEGAFGASFVSVFAKQETKEKKEKLACQVSVALTISVLILTLILFIFSEPFVDLLASKFRSNEGKFELTLSMTRLLLPFLYFASMAALSMGVLNTLGSYFIPSLGSAAFNLANIVFGGAFGFYYLNVREDSVSAIYAFAVGALIGGFFQWAVQWRKMKSYGFPPLLGLLNIFRWKYIRESFADPKLKRIMLIMAPSLVAVASMQVNVTVNTFFAASLEEGSVSWLVYAYRLLHFPMGIFGVAISMAALPSLARLVNHKGDFCETLKKSIRMSSFLAIGSAAGLIVFGQPLIALIFEHGRFTFEDTVQTHGALVAYSVGLLAFSLNKTLLMAFYALENVWVPSLVSAASVLTNFVFAWYFSNVFGHEGLALSVSFSSLLSSVALGVILWRRGYSPVDWDWLKLVGACALSLLPMLFLYYLDVPSILMRQRFDGFSVFAMLTLGVVGGVGILYLFLLSLLSSDGRVLWQALRRRFLRA